MQQFENKWDKKPISIRILQYLLYIQMLFSGFIIVLSMLFMWMTDEHSSWVAFKAKVIHTAFGITPQAYGWIHFTYLSGISLFTLIVLILFAYGIHRRIFLLCLIMAIVLVVLHLGNPFALLLAIITILLLTVTNARKYLNVSSKTADKPYIK